jgi:DNA-binding transcriptional MerR regulator
MNGLLKMSELAERSGVSAGTIKHYLREGLLGEGEDIVRTSRNMAYYPPEYVERIQLIKRLQEERFMPLRVIKERILEGAVQQGEGERVSTAEARRRYDVPRNVLDRLAEIGVLTPSARGYDADDVKIIAAIARFRAGGYDEQLGFTVFDTLRYRAALEPLVVEEVRTLLERLRGRGRARRGDHRRRRRALA